MNLYTYVASPKTNPSEALKREIKIVEWKTCPTFFTGQKFAFNLFFSAFYWADDSFAASRKQKNLLDLFSSKLKLPVLTFTTASWSRRNVSQTLNLKIQFDICELHKKSLIHGFWGSVMLKGSSVRMIAIASWRLFASHFLHCHLYVATVRIHGNSAGWKKLNFPCSVAGARPTLSQF